MSRIFYIMVLCISLVAFLGCDSDDGDDGGNTAADTTDNQEDATETTDVVDPEPTSYAGQATIVDFATQEGIEGAELCIVGSDEDCLLTDADGIAMYEYVPGTDVTMTVSVDGYWTARVQGRSTAPEGDVVPNMVIQMAANTVVDLLASQAPGGPVEISAEHGHIVLGAGDNGDPVGWVEGVTFTMTPASGVGPLYFAPGDLLENVGGGGVYDGEATATSDNGLGNVYNVEPGVYTLSATHESLQCVAFYGLPVEGDDFTVEVVAGQLSYAVVVCL